MRAKFEKFLSKIFCVFSDKTVLSKIVCAFSGKTVLNIILILCISVFLFSTYNILVWVYENKNTSNLQSSLIELGNKNNESDLINQDLSGGGEVDISKIKFLTTNISELQKLNSDTVAWIKVMGTNVDYPVVQTSDNDYYLTHDFNKKESKAGWVFGDFRCSFNKLGNNTILYGHERMDYSMFGSLTFCRDDWWYNVKTNHFIFLNTESQKTVWQIFSIYVTTVDFDYIKTGFSSKDDYGDFVESLNARNTIPTLKADATSDDKVITLSTCYNINKRLVVHGKLIKSESVYPSIKDDSETIPPEVSSDISSNIISDYYGNSSNVSSEISSDVSDDNTITDTSSDVSSDVSSETSSDLDNSTSSPDSSSDISSDLSSDISSDVSSSEESSSSEVSSDISSSEESSSSDISSESSENSESSSSETTESSEILDSSESSSSE